MKLKDKVSLITGGARGIGFGVAKVYLQEGAIVNICATTEAGVNKAVQELSDFGRVEGYVCEVQDSKSVIKMVESIVQKHGRIDILVNNAGITDDSQFYKMTREQWDRVLDINLGGVYNVSKAVIPYMMENKYGKIIHTTSVSAYNGNFGQTNYAASKAAIIGMTRVMGKELGKYNITVNAVAPGSIMTDMYAAVPDEFKEKKLKGIPLRRFGTIEEAGQLYAFLGSDESSYITAQTITIDGGFN